MKTAAYLALSGQTLIAAGTFLVAKDATDYLNPFRLVWLRIVLSAVLVTAVYAITHRGRPRPARGDWPKLFGVGLLGVTLNQGFFLLGISRSTPLHASLLYAFTPVLVLVGAALFLGERPTLLRTGGVVLALTGVSIVLTAQGLSLGEGPLTGDLILLAAVSAWAAYTLLGKDLLRRYDPFTVIVWSFGASALSLLPATPWVFAAFDPGSVPLRAWLGLLYLAAITSGVAFTLWSYGLKRLEASQTAVFNNLQAPLTALLAWFILGTIPEMQVVWGGLLVLAGVTLVQLPRRRRWTAR